MDLETQKKIIKLGKKMIEEVKLQNSVDTLSKWMIYYISELIVKAENETGEKKAELNLECCNVILKVWEQRHSQNAISSPFEKFQKVYEVLTQLNIDDQWSFYSWRYKPEHDEAISSSQRYWLSLIKELDQVVKVWIKYFSYEAANELVDEGINGWLDVLEGIEDTESDLLKQILFLEKDEDFVQEKKESLLKQLAMLEKFNEINVILIDKINEILIIRE